MARHGHHKKEEFLGRMMMEVKEQCEVKDNGIGLAIAKYYVEQHGGTIGFESKEGEGSTFWFELPIK